MENPFILIPLGFVVGTIGTLIGAGGGFILMPVLLFLYPTMSPDSLVGISLAVVFFNSFSGSLSYARMKRIEYKSGFIFALASLPGAIIGAYTTAFIARNTFDIIFGLLMIAASTFLLTRGPLETKIPKKTDAKKFTVKMTDLEGGEHNFSFNIYVGIAISFVIGFISSLVGIGGGIIHVPVLVYLLNFPVHLATATSHFVLAITSLSGCSVHLINGIFDDSISLIIFLGIGAVLGAQAGARLSRKIKGTFIIKGLALALGIVGVRLLVLAI